MILGRKGAFCTALSIIGPERLEFNAADMPRSSGYISDKKQPTCWRLDGQKACVSDILAAASSPERHGGPYGPPRKSRRPVYLDDPA